MYVSPACLDLTGYAPEELVGRTPNEFYHSDDLEDKQKGLERIRCKERFHTCPYRIRHKNGHYVWVETTGKRVINSGVGNVGTIVATTRDLGCRKPLDKQAVTSEKIDRRLQGKEEKFRMIAETVQDVFWVSTPGMQQVLYVSPAYETVWGRSRKRLYEEPRSFLDAIHPGDRKKLGDFVGLHAEGRWNCEYRIVRPDRSISWIKDRGYPVTDGAGNIRFTVGVASDVTELKQIQEALEKGNRNLDKKVNRRTADLETANRELKEKTETLRELNTALRVVIDNKDEAREDLKEHVISHLKIHIVPYLEKLKSTSLDPLQDTYVKVIEFNIEQAFDPLVSKLNSRYFNLSPAEIKIANLVKIGKTSKEIAGVMNISKGTVDWHRIQIRKKMGLQNKKISLRTKLRSIK
jgi:PAS domain S-box-containing protein